MDNSDIFRNLCSTFNFDSDKVSTIFMLVDKKLSNQVIEGMLSNPKSVSHIKMEDKLLNYFLGGFIIFRRGRKEDNPIEIENYLNNNMILRKIKIALNLRTDEIAKIIKVGGGNISVNEVNAFFRSPLQNQFRMCQDQYLRKFIVGLRKSFKNLNS